MGALWSHIILCNSLQSVLYSVLSASGTPVAGQKASPGGVKAMIMVAAFPTGKMVLFDWVEVI